MTDQTAARLDVRRPLRGGQAAQGAGLRARAGAPPAHPDQRRRPALRRRDVGRERAARPCRLRQQAARPRASRSSSCTTCSPRPWTSPRRRPGCSTARSIANEVGLGLVDDTRAFLESLDAARARRVPDRRAGRRRPARGLPHRLRRAGPRVRPASREYLMPPLPNTLYTRDTTCWLYGGLTLNPLYWPARHDETLIYKAIYTFHPDFVGLDGVVGRPRAGLGHGHVRGRRHHAGRQRRRPDGHERAHLAAGDHPGRGRAVRPGRGRARRRGRHAQAAGRDAPRHGLHVRRPGHRHAVPDDHGRRAHASRSARATRHPASRSSTRDRRRSSTSSPRRWASSELRVIETGGDVYASERQQWDSGNNAVAVEPGVVFTYDRNTHDEHPAAQGRRRGHHRSSAPSWAAAAAAGTA